MLRKSKLRNIILILSVVLITSCIAKREYQHIEDSDSSSKYEEFLEKFPKGKYSDLARLKLAYLYEYEAWGAAEQTNTIEAYNSFLEKYPNGSFYNHAQKAIAKVREDNEWNAAVEANEVNAIENFMREYPDSKYENEAIRKLEVLKEENSWSTAKEINTIESYNQFVEDHPSSAHYGEAIESINYLNKVKAAWELADNENTIEAYQQFVKNYSETYFAELGRQRLQRLDNLFWEEALRKDAINIYTEYLNNFPEGEHVSEANKKIIDKEVDGIFQGNHGLIPPLNRVSSGYGNTNEIEVYNNTRYNLTIYYSGIESTKVTLAPKQKTKFNMVNGNYRVAAAVDAINVQNYAGNVTLEGGIYSIEYYIATSY